MSTSTPGQDALAALRSMRELHRQCATLLRTSDEIADALGWEPWAGNQVLIQPSYSLEKAEQWLPDVLFRHYRPVGRRDITAFVALLLLPRDPAHLEGFGEPLLSAGWVRFTSDIPEGGFAKQMWLARAGFWTREARGGRFVPFAAPDNTAVVRRVTSWPLWDVQDSDALREAIGKLAADLAEHTGAP